LRITERYLFVNEEKPAGIYEVGFHYPFLPLFITEFERNSKFELWHYVIWQVLLLSMVAEYSNVVKIKVTEKW